TVTLHDGDGQALHTLRYGRMPQGDIEQLCAGLAAEVRTLLRKRPTLQVVLLADGAPELWMYLDQALNKRTLGVPVRRLIDLWHLLEKLGKAAKVLYGEAQASAGPAGLAPALAQPAADPGRDLGGVTALGAAECCGGIEPAGP